MRRAYLAVIVATLSILLPNATRATVIWDQATNGALSANQASPTSFNLASGTSSILATLSAQHVFVDVTVPAGLQLSALTLASYTSTDPQGFTGVQAGTSFVGNTNAAASYLGYTHFGTGATNGSLPTANLVGVNMLPLMGDNVNVAPGSTGFTPPLPAGSYAFFIQQLGASTAFQFDFGVTSVPEPGTGLLLLVSGVLSCLRHLRRRPSTIPASR